MKRLFTTIGLVTMLVLPVVASAAAQVPNPGTQNSCNTNYALFDVPGSYTFTVPQGVTQVRITAVGGGGGGGAGAGGWGSGGGGGCGGAIEGGAMAVTPGQTIPLYVGYGGGGGNGSGQCTISGFPWCGSFYAASDGSSGGGSGMASVVANGGGWGRTGFYNLYNQNPGGTGGGSGGGGGGNGWPGFYETSGAGGTAGGETNSEGAGGYCTGNGWDISPSTYIQNVPVSAGAGGYSPGGWQYWGGGGGGGLVINNTAVKGGDGQSSPNNGGKGYGGGGGGSNLDNLGTGGAGAPGAVYIEWDAATAGGSSSCALSCSITFDQNPIDSNGTTTIRWDSQNADLFYINNIGYVGATGSEPVSDPGDYGGSVSGLGQTASCPAVLAGIGNNQCTSGGATCGQDGNLYDSCGDVTQCLNGCSSSTNTCNTMCVSKNVCNAAGNRVINSCSGSTVEDCSGEGKSCVNGVCLLSSCPVGYVIQGNSCVFTSCPVGYTQSGNVCNFTGCPDGDALQGGQCVVYVPPAPKGDIVAVPSVVKSGATPDISWSAQSVSSCVIQGSNGDGLKDSLTGLWSCLTQGSCAATSTESSSPITSQTTYTLSCTGLDSSTFTKTATVTIVPVFEEK